MNKVLHFRRTTFSSDGLLSLLKNICGPKFSKVPLRHQTLQKAKKYDLFTVRFKH